MQPVIPPRSNRIAPRDCDWFVYKERHLIEYLFVCERVKMDTECGKYWRLFYISMLSHP
jgi:hypothetical protein